MQLHAGCIDESMRLTPPIPAVLMREVLKGGLTIDGHFIPVGVNVGVPPYAVMRNPKYYPKNPHFFDPSRWIATDDVSRESIELAQSAFCPFSIGPRSCVAKSLAYIELTLALASILWEVDMRLERGSTVGVDAQGNYGFQDLFVTKQVGPVVQFSEAWRFLRNCCSCIG